MRLARKAEDERPARIRLRYLATTASAFLVIAVLGAVRHGDLTSLPHVLPVLAISLVGFIPYLGAVRSTVGGHLVGVALSGAILGTLTWLMFFAEIDDGLEGLWIPYLSFLVGCGGALLDLALLRHLERRFRAAPGPGPS